MSFKDQLDTDLDVFFNNTEFADTATLNGVDLNVIFDTKDDVVFDSGLDSDVSASVPCITCKSSDVVNANFDDEVVLNNITYYIIDIDPALDGTRKLCLSKDRR